MILSLGGSERCLTGRVHAITALKPRLRFAPVYVHHSQNTLLDPVHLRIHPPRPALSMPSFSPAPPERPYELDTYAAESSRPLLNGTQPADYPSPLASTSSRRPHARHGAQTRSVLRRWWKPILAISTPFLFLLIYAVVHPHVPGLPPLPKVSIHSGYEDPHVPGRLDLIGAEEDVCRCGETSAGQRLCDVYQREGLRLSRAVEVTGARVRRVLQKAREGEKLKVGILGGSGESP